MRLALVLGAALAASGCVNGAQFPVYGAAFQWTTRSLTTNFNRTPVAHPAPDSAGSIFQLEYRNIRVLWGDNAIGSLGKSSGLAEVDYADVSTLSILGVFTMYRVHVYGHTAEELAAQKAQAPPK